MDIRLVISRLRPGASYHWLGNDDGKDGYEAIGDWRDMSEKPTEQECLAEWEIVLQERAAQEIVDEEIRFMVAAAKQQKVELLSLPNWATWTALEAETNIEQLITNGIPQDTAEAAVAAASNIASLRPILTNLVKSVYAINTILKAMAKCIVFIRDILKP